ncbi:hypothetical protein AK88_05507 [Plasmodium fragile]|uniref:Schizont-infected cell agglutination C-terminal domain-containing protein n=1 Tax=Plasmodium fragile TaxID=5857 RepID=A0A0D9QDF7_PLAFR|nr:uncharacterized protein AK88_05507 [Plasmodium fragile]KJP84862.1 hypothetical protein AK88_05507 [Plasmodium fragile]
MQKEQLETMKTVLQQFIDYMEEKKHMMDAIGANCHNSGWNDITDDGTLFTQQTVADVIRCKLMTAALWFANGDNTQQKKANGPSTDMNEMEKQLRCELANAFGYILHHKYCEPRPGFKRGIEYAWKTMIEMGSSKYAPEQPMTGPVFERRCTECGYNVTNATFRAVNGDIAELLITQGKIMDTIGHIEKTVDCSMKWDVYVKQKKKDLGTEDLDTKTIPEITQEAQNIVEEATRVIELAKEEVEKEIEKQKGKNPQPPPQDGGTSAETPKEPPAAAATSGVGQGPGPGSGSTAQQPPPPAQPPQEKTSADDHKGKKADKAGKCTESSTSTNTNGSGVSISLGCTADSALGVPDSTLHSPSDAAPGDAVVTGGNDDPPPLNPPKPKPNPNPNQSGSSGSFSDADLADGVSGGEGTEGGGGQKDAGRAGSGSPGGGGRSGGGGTSGAGQGGSGTDGAGAASTPATPSLFPELKWEDVKPYTPAIIPAVVGIGVIAFFLWKYFAHLGHKRRRTYRTVRDVPSPPLDEDILQHLQRGELPPPDYGYNMIRDRQPASTSARRRRPPRVHKRTIIELHLEVLNECEATEWENVKEDYLQILVEAFARALERDANGHSSFPNAPSTNQGLPGTNVTFTMDPPTDADGTDACPPHDPDPWSCMENIQLATHPCAPNEDDPDPCSAMETIPLATCPSASNEEDRWNCMETIPLATEPCAPNADDPDPWSCMETIQLEEEGTPAPFPSSSDPGDATSACTHWINWIDRHKHMLRACTRQTWFNALKLDWKQFLREHMVPNGASGEHRKAASMESKKHAWKEWVGKQHALMHIYSAQEWFKHLLETIEHETESQKGEVPGVETDLELEKVPAAEDMLRVRDVPRSQPLHEHYYQQKHLISKLWILILALVIQQCELECRLQEKELYVDDLLHKLCN